MRSTPLGKLYELSFGVILLTALIQTQSGLCSIDGEVPSRNDSKLIWISVTPPDLGTTEWELNILDELRTTPTPTEDSHDESQSQSTVVTVVEEEVFSTTPTYINNQIDEEETTNPRTINSTDIGMPHLAAQRGHEDTVKQLIAKGADVNVPDKNLATPLIYASLGQDKNASLRIIKILIENGSDVYATNDRNFTFFHTLLANGVPLTPSQFQDISAYLISKNRSNLFNKPRSSDGANPIQIAMERTEIKPSTLELLHENGADFKMLDSNRNSILTYALTGLKNTKLLPILVQFGAPWRNLNRNSQSLLHTSAYKCSPEGVKYFAGLGLDINGADAAGETPLLYAVVSARPEKDVLETCRVLVGHGANVNARNFNLGTPLIKSAYFPRAEGNATLNVIKFLIENGVDIYAHDHLKRNFLQVLVDAPPTLTPVQFHYFVEYLISEDLTDLFGIPGGYLDDSPLHVAVGNMEVENRTLDLLKQNGVNLGVKNAEGTSILARAVQGKRSLKLISHLIELGVNWREPDLVNRNLLHFAAAFDHLDGAKYFLQMGMDVDVNAFDFHGNTPLHYAVSRGLSNGLRITRSLVEGGANVNSNSRQKATPLHAAVRCSRDKGKCIEIIKYLINNQADIYVKDGFGRTFLHMLVEEDTTLTPSQYHDIATYLISKNLTDIFEMPGWPSETILFQKALKTIEVERETLALLQRNGINLNQVVQTGDSVLILPIAGRRSVRLISDLIDLGVDWNHLNHNQSVLHLASFFSHTEAVKLFLKLGLDVNGQDIFGNTPLHQLMKRGRENILETALVLIVNGADLGIEDEKGRTPMDIMADREDISRVQRDGVIQLLRYQNVIKN